MSQKTGKKEKPERVKVSIRVRPFNELELKKDHTSPITNMDFENNTLQLKTTNGIKDFTFDKIYPESSTQEEIYESSAKRVVDSVLEGFSGTIFAYGQTGTGKTYTMQGDFDDKAKRGIIPRAFEHIFSHIEQHKEFGFKINICFIQIYLEAFQDLLEPQKKDITIRDLQDTLSISGVHWEEGVKDLSEVSKIYHKGESNRETANTRMNAQSSRSHAVLVVNIEKWPKKKDEEMDSISIKQIQDNKNTKNSTLFLVDLAGSEKLKKSEAEGMRVEEAKKINFSLHILGRCINMLSEGKTQAIPFRDSKLTRLLHQSLGGNSKTSLIVTLSPSNYNYEEIKSSLEFGTRAIKIKNKPKLNQTIDYQALCMKLDKDLQKLRSEYAELQIEYNKVLEENKKLKNGETFVDLQKSILMIGESNKEGVKANNSNTVSNSNTNNVNGNAGNKSNQKNVINNINTNSTAFQIKKLELFYRNLIKNKEKEFSSTLDQIDNIFVQKENTIDELTEKVNELNKKLSFCNDKITELNKDKEDFINTVSDLQSELAFEKEKNNSKSNDDMQIKIDELNIEKNELEKKLMDYEKINSLNNNSIMSINRKIDELICNIRKDKNLYEKNKSEISMKVSRNLVKINVDKNELENLNKKFEGASEDMKLVYNNSILNNKNNINNLKLENEKLNKKKESINLIIANFNEDIKIFEDLKEDFCGLKDDNIEKEEKTNLYCQARLKEIQYDSIKKKYEDLNKFLTDSNSDASSLNSLVLSKNTGSNNPHEFPVNPEKLLLFYSNISNSNNHLKKVTSEISKISDSLSPNNEYSQINVNTLSNYISEFQSIKTLDAPNASPPPKEINPDTLIFTINENNKLLKQFSLSYCKTIDQINSKNSLNLQFAKILINNIDKIFAKISSGNDNKNQYSENLTKIIEQNKNKFMKNYKNNNDLDNINSNNNNNNINNISTVKSMKQIFDFYNSFINQIISAFTNNLNTKYDEANNLKKQLSTYQKENIELMCKTKKTQTNLNEEKNYIDDTIKKRDEIIEGLNKKITEKDDEINQIKNEVNSLKDENSVLEDKLNTEKITNYIEKTKVTDKDISTGHFLLREFIKNTRLFANDLDKFFDK